MGGKASYTGMQSQVDLARLAGVLEPKSATSEVPYVLGTARLSPSTPSYWLGANQGHCGLGTNAASRAACSSRSEVHPLGLTSYFRCSEQGGESLSGEVISEPRPE